jgi:hypothetical protein
MKRSITLFAVSLILLTSAPLIPQETANKKSSSKEACIRTLMQGLNNENLGLQAGCAYMLGEVCCEKGVVGLLDLLHNGRTEELRILAALSLYKIGDTRGIFAIKQAIRFDDSKRVSRMCEIFYKAHLKEKTDQIVDIASR